MKKLLCGVAVSIALAGCTHSTGMVDYQRYNMYTADNAGNMHYKEILPIRESKSSFFWTSCDTLASRAALRLYDRALAAGGNGIMNVRWVGESGFVITPTCETKYGWFLAYIVGGLGPWVKTTEVEGSIVKLNAEDLKTTSRAGSNIIILSSREAFLERLGIEDNAISVH